MEEKLSIMVVDDEGIIRESFRHWFKKFGHQVDTAASGIEALKKLEGFPYELLFVDIKMPGMDGIELLQKVKAAYPDTLVVIITAYGSIESAVQAMKLGASDYLLKPFKPDQLTLVMEKVASQQRLRSEYNYLKGRLEEMTRFDNIVGQAPAMKELFELIPKVAASDASVLIVGETGTGKELVAKAIHAKSPRATKPFIAINCGAIPEPLMEAELFGHQKGAFTGAVHGRRGFLEMVCGGTLFLDEVGEISAKMQVDLLRVLQEKRITRIGDREPVEVNFRLISATSRDVEKEIAEGRFREDFYYRINVILITIPPLRERREDIPLLVEHFLRKFDRETTKRVDRVSAAAQDLLRGYEWPGNVRELENAVERAVVLSQGRVLQERDFLFLRPPATPDDKPATLREMQKRYVARTLRDCDGNVTRAAKMLGINRVTLHKMIKRYSLRETPH